jgi:predicted GIY-YIG superfamily endonuclease
MPRTRKHLSLVSEYLENISRDALENHQNVIRAYVQRRQGVYALYRKGKLYYVGLAKDLRGRLTAHVRDRHGESWDRFSVYFTIGDQHLKEMESLILRIVKLKGNKVKGKFAKSRDLRRQFARDIRSEHRKEDALLLGHEWTDPQAAKNEEESSVRTPALAA